MTKIVKIGRPARVSPANIADAALKIGLDQVTLVKVAAALKMSVTGLRHHVATREDLIELAVNHCFAEIAENAPVFNGFKDCCLYYARHLFDIYSSIPNAIADIAAGFVRPTPRTVGMHEQLIALGVQDGFTAAQAFECWMSVTAAVLGAATLEAGERKLRRKGSSILLEIARVQTIGVPRQHMDGLIRARLPDAD